MSITSRIELLQALEQVKGAVAQKGFVPILTHVLVDKTYVLGYDSEIGVRVKLNTPLDCTFNIKSTTFLDLLKHLEDEDLDLSVDGAGKILIKCGSHTSRTTQIQEEFPKPNVKVTASDWRECPAGFKEALERCQVATSEDENNKALSAIQVAGCYLYAFSGKKAVRCKLEGLDVAPFLLPRKAVAELVRLGNPKRIAVTNSLGVFDFGDMTFIARLRDGESFPREQLDKLLNTRKATHPIPGGFIGALTRLARFTGDNQQVSVQPGALGLRLHTTGDKSHAEELLAPWPDALPFESKHLAVDLALPLLAYAEFMDWGGAREPFYFSGEQVGFEAALAPAV